MPLVPNSCQEVLDSLAFRVVHQLSEVVTQEVSAGLLKSHSGVENLRGKTSFVVRRGVVLEDVGQVVEIALPLLGTIQIRDHLQDCNDGYRRYWNREPRLDFEHDALFKGEAEAGQVHPRSGARPDDFTRGQQRGASGENV